MTLMCHVVVILIMIINGACIVVVTLLFTSIYLSCAMSTRTQTHTSLGGADVTPQLIQGYDEHTTRCTSHHTPMHLCNHTPIRLFGTADLKSIPMLQPVCVCVCVCVYFGL